MRHNESQMGIALMKWWAFQWKFFGIPYHLLAHVPNGGWRSAREGAILKASGVQAGFPDYLLLCPNKTHHALLCELKTPEGRVRPEQKQFMEDARRFGYDCVVAHSADEAREAITNYLDKR